MNQLQEQLFFRPERINKALIQAKKMMQCNYKYIEYDVIIKEQHLIVVIEQLPYNPLNYHWNPEEGVCEENQVYCKQYLAMKEDIEDMLRLIFPGTIWVQLDWTYYRALKHQHCKMLYMNII